jgi:hypothetical protein
MRFELIERAPKFCEVISDIRKEFNIPNGGFKESGYEEWLEKLRASSLEAYGSRQYLEKAKVAKRVFDGSDSKAKVEFNYFRWLRELDDLIPDKRFRNLQRDLVKRFHLSEIFQEGFLTFYIALGEARIPRENWVVSGSSFEENPINSDGEIYRRAYVSLKAYLPLKGREKKIAFERFEGIMESDLSEKEIKTDINLRKKEQFRRGLIILDALGYYRDPIFKKGAARAINSRLRTRQERLAAARRSPNDVEKMPVFLKPKIKKLADELKISERSIQKQYQRMRRLMEEVVGLENL